MRLTPNHYIRLDISASLATATEFEWNSTQRAYHSRAHQTVSLSGSQALERGDLGELTALLADLRKSIAGKFVPIRVHVADALARSRVYPLDETRAPDELEALAAWRLQREFEADTDLRCSTQPLGAADNRQLVLAMGIPVVTAEALETLFGDCGLVPEFVAPAMLERLNRHGALLQASSGWLIVEQDYWSLCVLDELHRPRLLRSRWRRENPLEDVAMDVTRTLRAFAAREFDISLLYVTAPVTELPDLAGVLDRMLPSVWHVMQPDEDRVSDAQEFAR